MKQKTCKCARRTLQRTVLRTVLWTVLTSLLLGSLTLAPAAIAKRDVDYSEDFSNAAYTAGTLIDNKSLPLHEFWAVDQFANYNAAPCSVFETEGDGVVLFLQSYLGMLSNSEMFDAYTYAVTLRLPEGHNGGVAITARHSTGSTHGSLYEADYYKENNPDDPERHDHDRGGFLQDYSGIAVYPTNQKNADGLTLFTVGVKIFVDDGGRHVSNRYYDLYLDVDTTGYFTISYEDKDNVLTAKVNDQVLCTVEMSDPGTFDDPADANEYYRTAVMKDAAGETVLELDNAKLAVKSRIAISLRASKCYVKQITAYSENTEVAETQPETQAPVTEPETQPETQPEATAPVTQPETDPVSPDETQASATEPESLPAQTSPVGTDADGDGGGASTDLILLILFGGLEVVLIGVLAWIVLRRKKAE